MGLEGSTNSTNARLGPLHPLGTEARADSNSLPSRNGGGGLGSPPLGFARPSGRLSSSVTLPGYNIVGQPQNEGEGEASYAPSHHHLHMAVTGVPSLKE